ncbi:MAG TPA: hypothetical protein VLA93_20175 [Pyrinomonadaceae bacterium]|nr:hypothetical protein [Pyrinomonadaceae bacterium]
MLRMLTGFAVMVFLVTCIAASFGQTRPAPNRPTSDFKVRYKVIMNAGGQAQSNETVTMIKGARERSESRMGYFDNINITQCDLKRTIQINDKVKKYLITPMEVDTPTASNTPAAPTAPPAPRPANPPRTGGIITYVTTIVDTGERREMFGFTARHVKSSTSIQSSPDACNPNNFRTELDGWYIDLSVEFNCNVGGPGATASRPPAVGGCRDQVKFRREGNGKIGYPLIETMRMYDGSGQVTFSTTKEVIELSRESLDAALFDIPAGYTQAMSQQEMYAAPSAADIMGNTSGVTPNVGSVSTPAPSGNEVKRPGAVRVGVVQVNNKSGKPTVSAEALRTRLINEIQGSGIEAIPLNGTSAAELEAEAKAKQCDYILYSDLASLKMSKLGGLFGSVTGAGGLGKSESKMEFKLFAVGETSPRLQSSSTAKEEGDENSAGVAISAEARAVVSEVKKRR